MSAVTEITSKIRSITQENSVSTKDIFVFGSSRVFPLGDQNVVDVTDVFKNDVAIVESGNWSYSPTTNKLTIQNSVSMTSGDIIEVVYTFYPNYSDAEIKDYIKSAIYHVSVNGYATFTYDSDLNLVLPEPSEKQQNLLAMIASILMKPGNKTYRLPDLTIQVAKDSLPTDEMIRKVIAVYKRNTHGVISLVGGP